MLIFRRLSVSNGSQMLTPTEIEKIVLIAVLRVLNLSQDAVASDIHIAKRTIVETEEWIRKTPLKDLEAIFNDNAIKNTVGRELPPLEELAPDVLIRAGQVTGDEILRHYREDYREAKHLPSSQAREYRSDVGKHENELSMTCLKLAEVLSWYHKNQRFTIEPFISSDFPYTAHQLEIEPLNERELSNLVAHLKDEIPELITIGKYPRACNQWFALGDKKWEKERPSVLITKDLILKLRLKGNQGNFSGRCSDCPR